MEKQRILETLTFLGKNRILEISLVFEETKDYPVLNGSQRNRILEILLVFEETKDFRDLNSFQRNKILEALTGMENTEFSRFC